MAKPPGFTPPSGKGANTVVGVRRLPRNGRRSDIPEWPLRYSTEAESTRWARLWRLPQALVWEEQGSFEAVARYVRHVLAAEEAFDAPLLGQVAQLEDRLGLTPKAMRLLLWVVVDDASSEFPDGRLVEDVPEQRATGTAGRRGHLLAVE